jgi:hypothetical protein
MKIKMIKKDSISELKKSEKKNLSVTKLKYQNGMKCIEFFNKNGAHRAFSKNTDKAIKKALKLMRNSNAKKAA